MKKKRKKSRSKMTYEEKRRQAEKVLRRNGYDEAAIEKIIKLSFGDASK